MQKLYRLGAKRFLLNNIWPLGCVPGWDRYGIGCNESINDMVRPYNDRLPTLLEELQSKFSGSVFSSSNNFQFVEDMKKDSTKYGWLPAFLVNENFNIYFFCLNAMFFLSLQA